MTANGCANAIIPVGQEPPPLEPAPPKSRPDAGQPDKAKGDPRTRLRFQTINAFIDVTMAELPPAERAVWLILWRDTKPTGLAQTSQTDLARRAGVTDRAVRTALRTLVRRGLVAVVRRGSLRRGVSIYRVHPTVREPEEKRK